MLRLLFLVIPFFFTANVSADTYMWGFYQAPTTYPSAASACEARGRLLYGKDFISAKANYATATIFSCDPTYMSVDGKQVSLEGQYTVNRYGDNCPEGSTYDQATGSCGTPLEDKCKLLAGTNIPSFKWSSGTDMPAVTLSIGGCAATVNKARCSYLTSGKASCTGSATYTGEKLESTPEGTSETCDKDDCSIKMQPEKKNEECVYVSNSSGSASCTAFNSENNPGNSDCGTVNGEFKCIRNPKATSTENKLESTKTEKSNTDGTVTTTKDNKLTTTKCEDKSCSTSTTTSKGTSTTDSNGNKIGETSTCSGANCNGKGETNGTGDSNKTGDEKGDEEGEEEGTDTPPVTPINPPEKGNLDGEADAWDTKIADSKTELKDALGKIKDSFSPVGELALGGGGGGLYCPPPVQVMGASFDICLDKYKDKLSWIGSAIFAVFAVISLLIIFN